MEEVRSMVHEIQETEDQLRELDRNGAEGLELVSAAPGEEGSRLNVPASLRVQVYQEARSHLAAHLQNLRARVAERMKPTQKEATLA